MRHLTILVLLLSPVTISDGADLGLRSTASVDLLAPSKLSFNPKTHVWMNNSLSGGLDLTVHCKSKNDDLGIHLLHPNEEYEFSFHPMFFWRHTLFFCSFQWPGAFHYFDIYVQKRDQDTCTICSWKILQDGPCRHNPFTKQYDNCYKWNPPVSWNARVNQWNKGQNYHTHAFIFAWIRVENVDELFNLTLALHFSESAFDTKLTTLSPSLVKTMIILAN